LGVTLIKNIRRYIVGQYFIENIDVVFNNRVMCIGECNDYSYDEMIEASNYVALPTLNDHYVYLHDYLHRLGLTKDNLSRNDISKTIEAICLEKILNGISGIFIDLGYTTYPLTLQGICKYMEVRLGQRVNNELISVYNNYIPIIDDNIDPNNLPSLIKEIENEVIYLMFLVRRRHPYVIKEKTGLWPMAFLEKSGVFGLNKYYYFIGLNWISTMDLEVLKHYRDRSSIILLPSKTMYIANGGFTPLYEIIETYKVRVFLGTSGLNSSILNEAKQALLLYRYNYWDQRLSIEHIRKTLFQQEHRLFRNNFLEKGSLANIVLYDSYISKSRNPLHSLIFNEVYPVYVFIKGSKTVCPRNRLDLINRYRDLLVEIID